MLKSVEFIVFFILLVVSFFAGVKYSDSVKEHGSWLYESKEDQEVELPDLSNEKIDDQIENNSKYNDQDSKLNENGTNFEEDSSQDSTEIVR